MSYLAFTLGVLFIAAVVYLARLALLTNVKDDQEYLEDLEDRVGALENFTPEVAMAKDRAELARKEVLALAEKFAVLEAATIAANKGIIQKLNGHELMLAGKPRANRP